MFKQNTTIINETGLHARPASVFVKEAKNFECKVSITKVGEEKAYSGTSVIQIMAAGLTKGTEICISADGVDEEKAVKTLVALVEAGFGE